MVRLEPENPQLESLENNRKQKSIRGQVTAFSYDSQQRLKQRLYETKDLNTFITINPHDSMFFGIKTFQARQEAGKRFILAVRKGLAEMGYTGFFIRHLKIRRKGWYTGQVLPHWHLYLCAALSDDEIERLKVFIVRAMELPGACYQKAALSHAVHASGTPTQQNQKEKIGYMVKPLCKAAMEAINGMPIGRSWGTIGVPEKGTPEEKPLTPEQEAIFRRQIRRQISAKMRAVSGRRMSKAMKLHMTDKRSGFTAYLPFQDIKRIYQFAVESAAL
jgi:hypothetical protein